MTIAVIAAVAGSLGLEGLTTIRRPPTPSKRSRAADTPVLPHVAGGGPDGGAIRSIALARTDVARVFVALDGGGVHASSDHGVTWTPADRGLPPYDCELVAEPGAGQTLYAACGDGLFKTTNGGDVWRQLDIDNPALPIIAPSAPEVLYQPPFGSLVRSRDGGRRWTAIRWSKRAQDQCGTTITVDPLEAATLYCAGRHDVLISRNDGASWRPLRANSVGTGAELAAIAIAPADRRLMFVTTADGQVIKTTTAGGAWTPLRLPDTAAADDVRVIDRYGQVVYARQRNRLVRSVDGGVEWQALSAVWPSDSLRNFAVDTRVPETVYAGTTVGLFVSADGGRTWAARMAGITRASTRVAVHDGARPTVFASAGRDVFTSVDDGATWSPFERSAAMADVDGSTLASDLDGGVTVQAGSQKFRLRRGSAAWTRVEPGTDAVALAVDAATEGVPTRSAQGQFDITLDGGRTWRPAVLPGGARPTRIARAGAAQPVLIAGVGGLEAVKTNQKASLWRSTDLGQSWQQVRVASPWVLSECCRLLVDPLDADTVHASVAIPVVGGGGAPELLRSLDGGLTWDRPQQPALSGAITLVATTPTTLLAQAYGGAFVRTTDRGDHWTRADVVPEHVSVLGFVFDRRRPAVVFAATDSRGVYRSTDAGATWQPTGRVRPTR